MFVELKFERYKYIVNVVLGEQHGAGVRMGTRCIWDAEADAYAYDSFINVRTAILHHNIKICINSCEKMYSNFTSKILILNSSNYE